METTHSLVLGSSIVLACGGGCFGSAPKTCAPPPSPPPVVAPAEQPAQPTAQAEVDATAQDSADTTVVVQAPAPK